jgi:N-acetylglucosaminyl-diphospho-decaprenol L-rhamnosyltransferase
MNQDTSPSPPRIDLDIVIVSWNAGDLLRSCLRSLAQARSSTQARWNVVVVDNASTDGSADRLPGELPQLRLLDNRKNIGFGAACNQGARAGAAAAILFINPDIEVEAGQIDAALAYLERQGNERIGVIGVRMRDENGQLQPSTARQPTPGQLLAQAAALDRAWPRLFPPHFMIGLDHAETHKVDQVMGAFLLIRRTLFDELGGFDERFFLYYEDADLCLRVRQAGWDVVHFAGTGVCHAGGGSTRKVKAWRLYLLLRSRVQFVAKHYSYGSAVAVALSAMLIEVPARIMRACLRGSGRDIADTLGGARMLLGDLPKLFGRNGR